MPFPGAKFNCYPNSVRTPLIIRWPGKIKKGTGDRQHMVAAVDFQSTILKAAGLPATRTDGRSFLPLIRGEKQADRDHVFAQFYHIHGKDALPMRSVLTRDFAYVFNPWSNGERRFPRLSGGAFSAMQQAAKSDSQIAARINHLRLRTVEEFFDLNADPGCLTNLVGSALDEPKKEKLNDLRSQLRRWMVQVNDPALHAFDHRDQPDVLEKFVQDYRTRAAKEVEALKPYEKAQDYRF